MTFVKTYVLKPYAREIVSTDSYTSIIDFLLDKYPNGFDMPTDVYINARKIEVDDYDAKLNEYDIIVLLERPAIPLGAIGGALITWIANAAISFALNYAINALFAPESPNRVQNNAASPVYNLNNSQNEAKIGQTIPVIYGTVRSYPSMIAKPYFRYEGNEQYLYHCLCVGQGSYSLNQLLIDDFDVTNNEDVDYKLLGRSDFYDIETATGDREYVHITNTLVTPSNLEISTMDSSVADVTLPESPEYSLIIYDNNPKGISVGDTIIFEEPSSPPNVYESFWNGVKVVSISTVGGETTITTDALYRSYPPFGNGDIVMTGITYSITKETQIYPIDNSAEYVEIDYTYPSGLFRFDSAGNVTLGSDKFLIRVYDMDTGTKLTSKLPRPSNDTLDPLRFTTRIDISAYSSYNLGVSFQKITPPSTTTDFQNKLVIEKIKELYPSENHFDYGAVTLLWVKIKATNAISSAGQTRVNGYFTRIDVNNDIKSVLTDIYTNQIYGARLSAADLDFPTTSETVNISIDQTQTVWDTMKQITKAQKYSVYPIGQDVVLKKDDVNNIVSGLYNETNILRGTLKADYFFKEEYQEYDGYKTVYMNADGWEQDDYTYPTTSLNPKSIELVGVTSSSKAEEMAKYLWKQEQSRRKIISFDTDIQGLVPQYLDKIKVSHSALNWGTAGEIVTIEGQNIELSDSLVDLTAVAITLRKNDGSVSDPLSISVTDKYNIIVLDTLPAWVEVGTFYTVGKTEEFIVTKIKPKDNAVTIECVAYDEDIYA